MKKWHLKIPINEEEAPNKSNYVSASWQIPISCHQKNQGQIWFRLNKPRKQIAKFSSQSDQNSGAGENRHHQSKTFLCPQRSQMRPRLLLIDNCQSAIAHKHIFKAPSEVPVYLRLELQTSEFDKRPDPSPIKTFCHSTAAWCAFWHLRLPRINVRHNWSQVKDDQPQFMQGNAQRSQARNTRCWCHLNTILSIEIIINKHFHDY